MSRHAIPYKYALEWVIENDDTDFLRDGSGLPSVSASLIADIYRRDVNDVCADLEKLLEKKP